MYVYLYMIILYIQVHYKICRKRRELKEKIKENLMKAMNARKRILNKRKLALGAHHHHAEKVWLHQGFTQH